MPVTAPWADELVAWSRAAAPREACGLVLGSRRSGSVHVAHVTVARNLARCSTSFVVDPDDVVRALALAHASGWALVGVWHSHVASVAEPSARDRAEAWPELLQVIVGPVDGACGVAVWRVAAQGVVRLRWRGKTIDADDEPTSGLGKLASNSDAVLER
ncbi:MAG: M67 family metallopeptidase [Planctomycetota bacterium]